MPGGKVTNNRPQFRMVGWHSHFRYYFFGMIAVKTHPKYGFRSRLYFPLRFQRKGVNLSGLSALLLSATHFFQPIQQTLHSHIWHTPWQPQVPQHQDALGGLHLNLFRDTSKGWQATRGPSFPMVVRLQPSAIWMCHSAWGGHKAGSERNSETHKPQKALHFRPLAHVANGQSGIVFLEETWKYKLIGLRFQSGWCDVFWRNLSFWKLHCLGDFLDFFGWKLWFWTLHNCNVCLGCVALFQFHWRKNNRKQKFQHLLFFLANIFSFILLLFPTKPPFHFNIILILALIINRQLVILYPRPNIL